MNNKARLYFTGRVRVACFVFNCVVCFVGYHEQRHKARAHATGPSSSKSPTVFPLFFNRSVFDIPWQFGGRSATRQVEVEVAGLQAASFGSADRGAVGIAV